MQKMKKTIESTEFLICFTSRPSSSNSLSYSLSSGSLKAGAASPMFPSSAGSRRKSGSSASMDAAAAEPSSPKVTCIGQVKIKAKKKSKSGKKVIVNRSRSVRSSSSSSSTRLRKTLSICDALNCFVPSCARSSCYSGTAGTTARERDIVARNDDRIGKFVGLIERREEKVLVFEEKEKGEMEEEEVVVVVEEEEKGRVSVCIPPRNALLLMRCRSDPVRMAALSSRFWDSPAMKVQVEVEGEGEYEFGEEEEKEEEAKVGETRVEKNSDDDKEVEKGVVVDEQEDKGVLEEEKMVVEEVEKDKGGGGGEVILGEPVIEVEKNEEVTMLIEGKVEEELKEEVFCEDEGEEVEIILRRSISCSVPKSQDFVKAKEVGKRRSLSYKEKKENKRHSFSTEKEARRHSICSEKEARISSFSVDKAVRRRWSFSIEKENLGPKEKPILVQSVELVKKEEPVKIAEPKIEGVQETIKVCKVEETQVVLDKEKKSRELPDCLLLMMYEPKLSMEVSKETWVCSTDFVHWRHHLASQPTKPKVEAKCDENKNANVKATPNAIPVVEQAPSKPEQAPSKPVQAVSPIDQKVPKSSAVGALPQVPYEQHFVLTRCKSEPMKSSARLMPDTCFWKSRHQPISTPGIGF